MLFSSVTVSEFTSRYSKADYLFRLVLIRAETSRDGRIIRLDLAMIN